MITISLARADSTARKIASRRSGTTRYSVPVLLHAGFDLGNYLERIFCTRIVGCENDHIADLARDLSHRRPFCFVAVAAAAKNGNDPALGQRLRGIESIQQSVVRMRVINDDSEIAVVYNSLETTRELRHKFQGP